LRWRRGLFRLWMVATALWLMFAGFLTDLGSEVSNYLSLEKVPIADTPGDVAKLCPKLKTEIDFDCLMNMNLRTSAAAEQQREYFASVVKHFVFLGTIVPVGVLAIGSALYWAIVGFVGNTREPH
jgi:hypothetical protein